MPINPPEVLALVAAEIVPDAGHAFAADNPDWMSERLLRVFADD